MEQAKPCLQVEASYKKLLQNESVLRTLLEDVLYRFRKEISCAALVMKVSCPACVISNG
jgi:hypothetical protein